MRNTIAIVLLFILSLPAFMARSQDIRTTATRVADLLALMPAMDPAATERLMKEMISLGDAGLRLICNQVLPAGAGDDVKPRFAVESLSRYLSGKGTGSEKAGWERICISYVETATDITVKYFFLRQLQTFGGAASADAASKLLTDPGLCSPAIGVIVSAGGAAAEKILSDALGNPEFHCTVQALNELANMKSELALSKFLLLSSSDILPVRAAALKALAESGNTAALKILSGSARAAGYKWEQTGAVASLLSYAGRIAERGDVAGMEKICNIIIRKCNQRTNIQFKTGALETLVRFKGKEAMPWLTAAAKHPDRSYRAKAMSLAAGLPGADVTETWMEVFARVPDFSKPGIIAMLADRGDLKALELIKNSLFSSLPEVRKEASGALVKMQGVGAMETLLEYMSKFGGNDDQMNAKTAIMAIAGGEGLRPLLTVLKGSLPEAQKTIIDLLAWSRHEEYFPEVLPYLESENEYVRSAAYRSLASLAPASGLDRLIELISVTDNTAFIADLQLAIANASAKIPDPEKRSEKILRSPLLKENRDKLIPVLGNTGGREALKYVLEEFESGDPGIREICFRTLTSWKDYSAATALYQICISGNKSYEAPAFNAYVRSVRGSPVTDEQKLLLYKKIMPLATTAERRNLIIAELGKIRTYQALFFTAAFLDNPESSAAAARAVMFIALPQPGSGAGMHGANVREILAKVITKLTGSEVEYERELIRRYIASMPPDEGFVSMFNGRDLTGWQGLAGNPVTRAKMTPAELAKRQADANKKMFENWSVRDGCIWFSGSGDNLCSIKEYSDFELLVDWKITRNGDSGIYLRGTPQVQIWDTSRVEVGAQVGSGGLYNNQKNTSIPLVVADNPVGEWNSFRIMMTGEKVSVWLNGIKVVDDVTLENYWNRSAPVAARGPVELQAHGTDLAFRDIYIREINEKVYNLTQEERSQGFVSLFNGRNLDGWTGDKVSYVVEDGKIVIRPGEKGSGNLYSEKEYSDFIFRFEFLLSPAANNGLGIRAPLTGDAAYEGMELQILDDTAPVYADLEPYQYHGSVYGVIPARRGFLKPVGEWNSQEVIVKGTSVKVILNGTTIVDGDIAEPRDKGTIDKADHPGLKNISGHIGFLGHGSVVSFRNIRIREI